MEIQSSSQISPRHERKVWGIVGGLGPLASAEFLKTIYEGSVSGEEQAAPAVILLSDPDFPDRTGALEAQAHQELAERLSISIRRLIALEVTDIVICCVTLHAALPHVAGELRAKVTSLIDIIVSAIAASDKHHLLVCTNGSRSSRLFEKDPAWHVVRDLIVLPDREDQSALHRMIYEVKHNLIAPAQLDLLSRIADKYGVSSFIAGCTEMHILHRYLLLQGLQGLRCVDPLQILAARISNSSFAQMSV